MAHSTRNCVIEHIEWGDGSRSMLLVRYCILLAKGSCSHTYSHVNSDEIPRPVQVTGIYKGDWSQVYGLSFLVFNTEDKIEEVLTLMQPFPAQRRGLLKREE